MVSAAFKDEIDLLAFSRWEETQALVGLGWIQLIVAILYILKSHLSLAGVSGYREIEGVCCP